LENQAAHQSAIWSFAQLCRLPNLFTAWADVIAGYVIVTQFSSDQATAYPLIVFGCVLAASSLIYSAGMVLNDYFDRDIDAQERPHRPIPSGAIDAATAFYVGLGMLAVGIVLATLAGYVVIDFAAIPWRGGLIALLLSASVLLYDAALKTTFLAPWLMGACRFFNILLGMSLAEKLPSDAVAQVLGYDLGQLMFAAGIGLYIVGVTWFARTEARTSHRGMLLLGALIMAAGISLLAAIPMAGSEVIYLRQLTQFGFLGLLCLLSLSLLRRVVIAIAMPEPRNVQLTIKQAILSLIFFDAVVTLAVCGSPWAVAIVALLIPMLGLRRWMYST